MSESVFTKPSSTIFERVWEGGSNLIFRSTEHGIMAVADAFPRMPLQVVVATAEGKPGEDVSFYDLNAREQRRLLEVGLAVGEKILEHCLPNQRSMFTLEGFAVMDHPHLVYYAGEREQGIDRYTGPCLGEAAVNQTLELVQFSPVQARLLEARLNQITY